MQFSSLNQFAFAFIYLFFWVNLNSQIWEPFGGDDFNQAYYQNVNNLHATVDSFGVIYAIATDITNDGRAFVRKFENDKWSTVGNDFLYNGNSQSPSINYSKKDGGVYVVYDNDAYIYFKKFEQNQWVDFAPSINIVLYSNFYFRIAENGDFFICYHYLSGGNSTAYIKKLENNNWVSINGASISNLPYIESFEVDHENDLLVSYKSPINNETFIEFFNGTGWQILGGAPVTDKAIFCSDLAIDKLNRPIFAYKGWFDSSVTVKKYQNGNWSNVATNGVLENIASEKLSINFNEDNHLYLIGEDLNNFYKAAVFKYDWIQWSRISDLNLSFTDISDQDILFKNNLPVVFFRNIQSGNTIAGGIATFKQFENNEWNNIGGSSITRDLSKGIAAASSKDGSIFFIAKDMWSNTLTSTWRLNYDQIEKLPIDSIESINGYFIQVDSLNIPHVGYNIGGYKTVLVKKYINNEWVNIGSPNEITAEGKLLDMQFDTDNNLFVLYSEEPSGIPNNEKFKIYLKKFNNGTWEYYKNVSNHIGRSYDGKIKITKDGTAFIIYGDLDSGNITVKKIDEDGMSLVGNQNNFKPGQSTSIDLNFSGDPFIAWHCTENGLSSVCVFKFENNEWINLTEESDLFATNIQTEINIKINKEDETFLSYKKKRLTRISPYLKLKN
ncbi:MAG: hypothetical protein R2825_03415 [Saprospiraceae bacterium]